MAKTDKKGEISSAFSDCRKNAKKEHLPRKADAFSTKWGIRYPPFHFLYSVEFS